MNYAELLEMFVGTDPLRPIFEKPFRAGEFYCATDSFAMLYFPAKDLDLPYSENGLSKGSLLHINPAFDAIRTYQMPVEMLEKNLLPKIVNESNSCFECEGDGTVKWTYKEYHQFDKCPVCKGSGNFKASEPDLINKKIYSLNDSVFQYQYLRQLLDAAKLIGAKYITHRIHMGIVANYFDLSDDIHVVMMPITFQYFKEPFIELNTHDFYEIGTITVMEDDQ